MRETDTTAVSTGKRRTALTSGSTGGGPAGPRARRQHGGFSRQYKPDQGKMTRTGTFIGAALLIAWGAVFLNGRLAGYVGDELWLLLITPGIPILVAVVLGVVAWRIVYVSRKSSDFMIATEGEMKKVSWSTRHEVVGSTKVVIMFTLLLAVALFVVDLVFQRAFSWIGVLKT